MHNSDSIRINNYQKYFSKMFIFQFECYPLKLTKEFVEFHMKCFKVTVFKYSQKQEINIAPNASFLV